MNKVSLVWVSSCSNTGSIRDDPYWTSRKNSLVLVELSSINKFSFSLQIVSLFMKHVSKTASCIACILSRETILFPAVWVKRD